MSDVMRAPLAGITAMALTLTLASAAAAQEVVRPGEWSRGTTLSGFAGLATDGDHSGPSFGGVAGWEISPRLTIEGSGAWLDFGDGVDAFAGAIKLRARLSGRRTVDPFVLGGIGFYRATFDSPARVAPRFYGRRLGMPATPGDTTFTDPALVAGAGLNIFVSRHFAVRPDVESFIVFRGRHRLIVTSVALHAVFHIESHPVTPRVR
jgi:hypothetical protein